MNYTTDVSEVKHKASQCWPELYRVHGTPSECLTGAHTRCPLPGCHGKKSFRFQNKCKYTGELKGLFVCTHCTGGALRDGFTFVALKCFNGDNSQAFKSIARHVDGDKTQTALTRKENSQPDHLQITNTAVNQDIYPTPEFHAAAIIAQCDLGDHPYLIRKEITSKNHLINSIDYPIKYLNRKGEESTLTVRKGALIVPLRDLTNDSLVSLQFINADGWRGYLPGSTLTNAGHVIEGVNDSILGGEAVGICEGFSTCLSLNMATGGTIIMLLDAGGMVSKCQSVAARYSDKKIISYGDNDSHKGHTKGQDKAREAAALTQGIALIPPYDDWDFHRKTHGIEATKHEITRQLVTFSHINVAANVIGRDISYPVTSQNGTSITLGYAAMHGTGHYITDSISGDDWRVNAGNFYSIKTKQTIIIILTALHNEPIINELLALKTTKERVRCVLHHNTKQHVYALAYILRGRFGSSLALLENFERLLQNKIEIDPEIKAYCTHLFDSKVQQAAELYKLDSTPFKKNYRHLKHDATGRLDWAPIAEEIRTSDKKVFAIQALQGSGKTEDLARRLVRLFPNVVYITHRQKLVAQAATTLDLWHYKDEEKHIKTAGHVPRFACCTPSLNKEINLNHVKRSKLIILDEFIQWFGDLLTNEECIKPKYELQARLQKAMQEAMMNGCKFVLLDADLINKGLDQFKRFLDINFNDILLIEAEKPQRDQTADISFSTSPRHYQTYGINLMTEDLANNLPFLVAMESVTSAQALFEKVVSSKPDKHIVLLIGGKCLVYKDGDTTNHKTKDFIDKINPNLSTVDVLIYTNVIGTGVSITHAVKRFTKCYGFFSGWTLSAMDAVQMIKRGRDVTQHVLCILDRPNDYMISFHHNAGAEAWGKLSVENGDIETLTYEVEHGKRQNSALFGPCLIGLLRDKHSMILNGQLSVESKIEGLTSSSKIKEGEQTALMSATPHPDLKHAQARQMDEYNDDEERFSCEATIALDYFKERTEKVSAALAAIWWNPAKREACNKLESIVRLDKRDPDLIVNDAEKRLEILTNSGIIGLLNKALNNQRLTQDDIKSLRDRIDPYRAALFGIKLLPEKYSKKIPSARPFKTIQKIIEYLGIDTKTIKTGENGSDSELEISIPSPMVSRLGLTVNPSKKEAKQTKRQKEKAEAHSLKESDPRLSLSEIGERMNKTKRQVQELLKN